MSEKKISIRIGVDGGDKARRELSLTGEAGEKAMRKINAATKPASKGLTAINVVAEQARFGMQNLAGGSGTLGISLMRLGPAGLAAAAGIGGIALALQKSAKEFMEAEHAMNHLNMALKATDFASGLTARKIMELGESLEKATLFKKEDIMRAASSLTSFGNIQGKVFEKAITLSSDLAVRLGTDVPSAADTLARVLERPEDGLGRLSRSFGDLSFAQREAIRNFIEQGDVMSAQMVIINHLESKVKGLAEAQATGLTGSINTLSDAFGDLGESIWKVIERMKAVQTTFSWMTDAVNAARKTIDPTLIERRDALQEEISKIKVTVPQQPYFKPTLLDRKRAELAEVEKKIAQQEKEQKDAEQTALDKANKNAFDKRNDRLLELGQKYRNEQIELMSSPQQKILTDHARRLREIEGLSKQEGGVSAKDKQAALDALKQSTGAKLAATPGLRTGEQAHEQFEAQKQAIDEWRDKTLQSLDAASTGYEDYAARVEQIHNTRLKEAYANSLANSTDWSDGAQRALLAYSESAMNAAANAEKVFGGAAQKAEDVLTNAVMKGKLSFDSLKDFALSTLEDITRAMIRQSITGPLAGLFGGGGGLFGGGGFFGLFHEGGVVGESKVPLKFMQYPSPSDFLSHIPRLHSGLAPDEFPAILQRGETVLPKNTNRKFGESNINIVLNISTPNVQSFAESRGQIMATLAGEMDRFRKRNR